MRDSQRSKVYRWEGWNLKGRDFLSPEYRTPLNEDQARELVAEVWEAWGMAGDPPSVRIMGNRGRGSAGYDSIKLSSKYPTTSTTWYILHELSHVILGRRVGWACQTVADHGSQFCALYANLLHRFTDASRRKVVESMRSYRINVNGKK